MRTFSAWSVIVVCLILRQQEVVASYFLYPNCGISFESNVSYRIVRGTEAKIKSAPFMAYLFYNSDLYCGGTVITHRYILTAAHCIRTNLKVRLGEHDSTRNPDCQDGICNPPAEEFDIQMATKHRAFGAALTHDIALLKLTRNIVFNVHIQPICLLLNPAASPIATELQAFGWGRTATQYSSSVLQTTRLTRYNNSYCQRRLPLLPVTQNQICVGLQGSDTCKGDSGGPLVVKVNYDGYARSLQLGIVSYGEDYCQSPGVYTFVPNYIQWIQHVMQTNGY
uniref:Thrombin-like enzyme bothrombin n=1 Tax=Drosophila rhopaloa TaxID=1041015 RepID=A0A6P4F4X2_DRORH